MCYYISIGLFGYRKYTEHRANYTCMISPANFVGLPAQNRMANHILFEKEINFCMTFMLAMSASWPASPAHG